MMRYVTSALIFLYILLMSVTGVKVDTVLGNTPDQKQIKHKASNQPKLLNRIDFGDSHILGQTIKSGAVYLLQRKKSEIKSMLKYRENYREEILEDFSVLDENGTDTKTQETQ